MNSQAAPRERRITLVRSETVLERTEHELLIPPEIPDEQTEAWARARFNAGELPPAIGLRYTMLVGEADGTVAGCVWHEPNDARPPQRNFSVAASESPAHLALRFNRSDGVTLTVARVAAAQLTYEGIRAGEDGEHIAAIGEDGTITTGDSSRPGGPTWVARFARAAAALGGRFDSVAVHAQQCAGLALTLSAGNEENPNLTIGAPPPSWLGGEALINADGVRRGTHPEISALIATRSEDGYWSLNGELGRYSDVNISSAFKRGVARQ